MSPGWSPGFRWYTVFSSIRVALQGIFVRSIFRLDNDDVCSYPCGTCAQGGIHDYFFVVSTKPKNFVNTTSSSWSILDRLNRNSINLLLTGSVKFIRCTSMYVHSRNTNRDILKRTEPNGFMRLRTAVPSPKKKNDGWQTIWNNVTCHQTNEILYCCAPSYSAALPLCPSKYEVYYTGWSMHVGF